MFTDGARSLISSVMGLAFNFFKIQIPGTNITFFQLGLGIVFTIATINLVKVLTGGNIPLSGIVSGARSLGGNSKKIRSKYNGNTYNTRKG